jgi:hypothetical protein
MTSMLFQQQGLRWMSALSPTILWALNVLDCLQQILQQDLHLQNVDRNSTVDAPTVAASGTAKCSRPPTSRIPRGAAKQPPPSLFPLGCRARSLSPPPHALRLRHGRPARLSPLSPSPLSDSSTARTARPHSIPAELRSTRCNSRSAGRQHLHRRRPPSLPRLLTSGGN